MDAPKPATPARTPLIWAGVSLGIIPLNFGIWWLAADNRSVSGPLMVAFVLLAALQFLCGLAALVTGSQTARSLRAAGSPDARPVLAALVGVLAALGAVAGGFLGWVAMKIP